jgi:hypothetical protein
VFVRYIPKKSGEAPPQWTATTPWSLWPNEPKVQAVVPSWIAGSAYGVPITAVDAEWFKDIIVQVRGLPIEKAVRILMESFPDEQA